MNRSHSVWLTWGLLLLPCVASARAAVPKASGELRPTGPAVTAPASGEKILDNLLQSFAASNYENYCLDLDETAKKALDKPAFERAAKATSALFGAYKSRTYLGSLQSHGYIVHLWKARFESSEDDVLIKLSLTKDEAHPLVGGFWLQ